MSGEAWIGLGTIFATFVGPIAAVIITRFVDQRREVTQRRLDVFRMLMKTRRIPVSAEFVAALNLIDIEFYGCTKVIEAWRVYLSNLSGPGLKDGDDVTRFVAQREQIKTNLLLEMARVLRLQISDLEIFKGGYVPQGLTNLENDQANVRRFLLELAAGRNVVPVEIRRSKRE